MVRITRLGGQSDALPAGIPSATSRDVPLFLLNYCHPDGRFDRFAGVVVVESYTPLHATMKAEVLGADRGLDFAGAHELDAKSARQVPADMIGRLLDEISLSPEQRMALEMLAAPGS